ncbi:glycosyltransferase [Terriglobus saanensis]|uniref:Glycosyl transferase family 2 n=1 Tax=Terriglobus saanensis (strain ATCC BAA-1853 / DSM 23119 / SP1PR4) TaxID=401053 RepID=E8V5W4_TERSS|nr:glycosyltransferase [Terriglobus saanensis]ADV83782.1 glycosyl transferase family 2 [Terriglobus saanensis SP1PR4]
MNLFLHILLGLAILGTATSTIYCGMVVMATLRFGRRRRRDARLGANFLPPISVLKPLHGAEPGLAENLERFFTQDYPDYELIFCARHASDAGLQIAQTIAQRYPEVNARFLTCGEPQYPNAKMWSLAFMAQAATHDLLVTSDADARVVPSYLRECIQSLADGKTALASCMYIGTVEPGAGLSPRLDAIGKSVEMVSGCLVADMVEGGTRFALGVTMILPRQSFLDAGGYEDLGQYFAEDFVLGNRLAESGRRVIISSHVIRLVVLETPFAESFRNQVRWMKSTRRSRPLGHLGSGLTFAVPFGLIGLLWGVLAGQPLHGAMFLLAACANRILLAAVALHTLGEQEWFTQSLLYPLRDLMGGILWVGSYCGSGFTYHDANFELTPDGRVVPATTKG